MGQNLFPFVGHRYEFVKFGSLARPEKFKCAFCHRKGRNYVQLRREDGAQVKVGRRCYKLGVLSQQLGDDKLSDVLEKGFDDAKVKAKSAPEDSQRPVAGQTKAEGQKTIRVIIIEF